jgi:hypothetical protein
MRLRLRTLQVVVAVAAAPLWTLRTAVRYGCADRVIAVWGVLVAIPVLLLGLGTLLAGRAARREPVVALLGAIAIVGYAISIPASLLAIGQLVP